MTPPAREPLSRRRVAEAALDLVDEAGTDALTMRRLADHLDVTPMALYNHVASRAELLDAIADLVARDMVVPIAADTAWDDRVRAVAVAMREAYLRHPAAIPLVRSARNTSPALEAPYRVVTTSLLETGVAPDVADQAWVAVVALVNGHVDYQRAGHVAGIDPDVAFTFAIDALLAGIAVRAASRP